MSSQQKTAAKKLGAWLHRLHLYSCFALLARTVERLQRPKKIRRYLESSSEPRLQIGCGGGGHQGWLNTDYHVNPSILLGTEYTFLDITKPLPFDDNVLVAIYAEHVIEHFDLETACHLVRECHRVLKPGGKLRLVTPDLGFLAGLLAHDSMTEEHKEYSDAMLTCWWPTSRDAGPRTEEIVFNGCMREWGHQFLYSEFSLMQLVLKAGFAEPKRMLIGRGGNDLLCDIESRAHGPDARLNALESLVLEATRP